MENIISEPSNRCRAMVESTVDFIPIVISVAAFAISIVTFYKKQKSDQFRIFLDIYSKLEEINYQRRLDPDNLASDVYDQAEEYLKTLELVSFLINNREITNKNMIKYFQPLLTKSANAIFEKYPDIEKKRRYGQLREFQERSKK
jgi:SUMO ligase MMS21 Smc5/6 complex component